MGRTEMREHSITETGLVYRLCTVRRLMRWSSKLLLAQQPSRRIPRFEIRPFLDHAKKWIEGHRRAFDFDNRSMQR
jgi:hypothetical protein